MLEIIVNGETKGVEREVEVKLVPHTPVLHRAQQLCRAEFVRKSLDT